MTSFVRLLCASTALALTSCGGTTELATTPDVPQDAGAEAGLQEASHEGGDASGTCSFEDKKSRYLSVEVSGTEAGVCKVSGPWASSSYDGAAVVQSTAATAIKLSFGSDCELRINNEVPEGSADTYDPAVLPALKQGATLWLTLSYGTGTPYSGEAHTGFALRDAQNGPVIVANQRSTDQDPTTALASASALGLQVAMHATSSCEESIDTYGCYHDLRGTWHSVDVSADQPVTVPSGASRDVTLGGKAYVLAVAGVKTYSGVYDKHCEDGPTYTGYVASGCSGRSLDANLPRIWLSAKCRSPPRYCASAGPFSNPSRRLLHHRRYPRNHGARRYVLQYHRAGRDDRVFADHQTVARFKSPRVTGPASSTASCATASKQAGALDARPRLSPQPRPEAQWRPLWIHL